ncbi:hypothetical protein [Nostoc sp. CALU 1950]|uniref:hypothetical protein n=1 Tax=Nostoc sp. CALU 1950 TaxID=3104321 RepID=UPI003EBEA9D3
MWNFDNKHGGTSRANLERAYRLAGLLVEALSMASSEITLNNIEQKILHDAIKSAENVQLYLEQASTGERSSEWFAAEAIALKGQLARLTTRMRIGPKEAKFLEKPNTKISTEDKSLTIIRQDLREMGVEDSEHSRYFIQIAQQVLEEIESITRYSEFSAVRSTIVRTIKPKSEHKQVVLSVLNYFGRIVEQKYKDKNIVVKTEQKDDEITFVIEMDAGDKGEINDALYQYGQVVLEEQDPSKLLPSMVQALELKHKLDMAKMELKHTTELLHTERYGYRNRIEFLEDEVSWLKKAIGDSLTLNNDLQAMLSKISTSKTSLSVQEALKFVIRRAFDGIEETDRNSIFEKLVDIQKSEPGVLEKLKNISETVFTHTTSSLLSNWITTVLKSLPE